MLLPYRDHYNKPYDPERLSQAGSIEMLLQLSTWHLYRVAHDPEAGLRQNAVMLDRSKSSATELQERETVPVLDTPGRMDLLLTFLKWRSRSGERLGSGELRELLEDLRPAVRHYNNVIIADGGARMSFEEVKDFSKRELRTRTEAPAGYRGYRDLSALPACEQRLRDAEERLPRLKHSLVEAVRTDRCDAIIRLSREVADLVLLVRSYEAQVGAMRGVMEALGGTEQEQASAGACEHQ